jgi:CheY-like chemotaxis protein
MNWTILLADADASVRRMVARVLESAGYGVRPACTAAEAVAEFRVNAPHLVLLDLEISEEGGWDVLHRIRRLDPCAPVILMTSWPNRQQQAIRSGIDALLEKPLDLGLLLQVIADLLPKQQPSAHRLQPSA